MQNHFILFIILSILTISFALMVVVSKSPIKSAVFLILTFFMISAHYLLLNAQFLAVVNIIVYAGAIMVLFLFVIMMINMNKKSEKIVFFFLKILSLLASGAVVYVVVLALNDARITHVNDENVTITFFDGELGLIKNLGKVLFSKYVIPFEISSVLFLSTMISVVVIGKSESNTNHNEAKKQSLT